MVKDVPYNIDDTVKQIMASSKLPKKLDVDSYYALAGYTCVITDHVRVLARKYGRQMGDTQQQQPAN